MLIIILYRNICNEETEEGSEETCRLKWKSSFYF